ncbi:MAG: protein kinase [Myxococcota bacterium]
MHRTGAMMMKAAQVLPSADSTDASPLGPVPGTDVEDERLHAAVHNRLFASSRAPTRVDRFVIEERLGAGGMGVVFSARDEQLQRKVALKLLHSDTAGRGTEGRARLIREARALARLSHRNVVSVHEVGTHGGRVFVAMEFLEGKSFNRWLEDDDRTLANVIETLEQVGRGLSAAHAGGVVHRDVKPANVIIGSDGRACLVDFGLAAALDDDAVWDEVEVTEAARPRAERNEKLEGPLMTRTGAVMGTPAYMSPEQHVGGQVDARTDQFSFAVMAWEALYGVRPFQSETRGGLLAAIASGVKDVGTRRGPARLRAALTRALEARADARFPTMDELLDAFGIGRRRARRRLLLAGAPLVAVSLGAAIALAPEPCADAGEASWWQAARPDAVALLEAHPTTLTRLDAYAARWSTGAHEACVAAQQPSTQEHAAQATVCLSNRARRAEAMLAAIEAEPAVMLSTPKDLEMVLPDPMACLDPTRGTDAPTPQDPAAHALLVRGLVELKAIDRALGDRDFAGAHAAMRGLSDALEGHDLALLRESIDQRRALTLLAAEVWPHAEPRNGGGSWHVFGDKSDEAGANGAIMWIGKTLQQIDDRSVSLSLGQTQADRSEALRFLVRSVGPKAARPHAPRKLGEDPLTNAITQLGNAALAQRNGQDSAEKRMETWFADHRAVARAMPILDELAVSLQIDLALDLGRDERARTLAQEAVDRETNATAGRRVEALVRQGSVLLRTGSPAEALAVLLRAGTLVEALVPELRVNLLLAQAHRRNGEIDLAAEHAERAFVPFLDREGPPAVVSGRLVSEGAELRASLAVAVGDYDRARELLNDDRFGLGSIAARSSLLALTEARAGQLEAARRHLDTALSAPEPLREIDFARVTLADAIARDHADPNVVVTALKALVARLETQHAAAPDQRRAARQALADAEARAK